MKSQKADPEKQLERLERRHRKLKDRVAEYEARVFLNTIDQTEVAKLKKEKLATKDRIQNLRVS
jgi:hypothetical protein